MVVCAILSPHLYTHAPSMAFWHLREDVVNQCLEFAIHAVIIASPPIWQLHSDFGNFNNGVCDVMKITIAESNPDIELLKHRIQTHKKFKRTLIY